MRTRRDLIIAFGVTTLCPQPLFAQAKQPATIGWLSLNSRGSAARTIAALKEGLAALGWKEGSQIVIEERWADGQDDRLGSLAQELAARNPALIVAAGLRAAVNVTRVAATIPIVMVSNTDPVAAGLVTSFARPGGMITGLAGFAIEITGKHLELLLAAAPKVKRVGFLIYSGNPNIIGLLEAARRSATRYSAEARIAAVARPEEIEPAMVRLAKEGAQGLVVLTGGLLSTERQRILKFAQAQRWPVVAGSRAFAEGGALLSYGADPLASYRRAAYYVDRILKGAKPADLPIEQPTIFELTVNMKTAKALGLTIPREILVRVDRVIE